MYTYIYIPSFLGDRRSPERGLPCSPGSGRAPHARGTRASSITSASISACGCAANGHLSLGLGLYTVLL